MSKLKTYKFSDLYKMSSGISSKPEQAGHGSQFVSFKTVFNNYFLPDVLTEFMDISEKEKEIYSVKKGDVFLTRTSETLDELGMSCVAVKDYPASSFSGFLKRLRPIQDDITYDKFMAFYLRSDLFRKTMTNNSIMTLRASLNEQIFSYLELVLPEYNEQKKAGDFLYSLNTKIELNNRINFELEAMAKTLYDYWFVQFDFPDVNGKPYKSTGGRMDWNMETQREIPDGWDVKLYSEWINNDKGGDWGKEQSEGNYTERVYCIRGADINGLNRGGELKSPERYILKKNLHKNLDPADLIVEISGGSPTQSTGRLAFITEGTLARFDAPIICSNFCKAVTLKNKKLLYNFVYHWQSIYDAGVLFGYEGKTSGIKNLLFDSFVSSHFTVVPEESIANKFYDFMEPIQAKKQKNLKENKELASLRDWLLPMLMNGQVSVGDVEEQLGMVAEENV